MSFILGGGFIFLLIAILASVFWIWAIIDCATNPSLDGTEKVVWLLVVIFLHLLGALLYFLLKRR